MIIGSLTAVLLNGLICVTTAHNADNIKQYSHIQPMEWLSDTMTPFSKILHGDNLMSIWEKKIKQTRYRDNYFLFSVIFL